VIEDYIFDLSSHLPYQEGHRLKLSDEYERQLGVAASNPGMPQPIYDKELQVGRKNPMESWGKMIGMYPFGPTHTVVDDVTSMLPPIFPKYERNTFQWQHFVDNTVPLHKDPSSLCWIAFNIRGDQNIYFSTDEGENVGEMSYTVALVNSKRYHAPRSDGSERLLLRKTFVEYTYDEVKECLNEYYSSE
jgi:hypothetical protein|tara:strand:+ start:1938 stop:2504 length:567 start_codon:yes stop_codon:yes gene_type:complete